MITQKKYEIIIVNEKEKDKDGDKKYRKKLLTTSRTIKNFAKFQKTEILIQRGKSVPVKLL